MTSPSADQLPAEPAAAPATAPAVFDIDAALAQAVAVAEAEAAGAGVPDATSPSDGPPADGTPDAPAEDRPSSAPETGGDSLGAPDDAGLDRLPENSRRALLKQAEERLAREQDARRAAEERASRLESLHGQADALLAQLEGSDEQVAELKRRARSGDTSAREQADIYEANREMLGPVRVAMRRQEAQRMLASAAEDLKLMARHLPESERARFLDGPGDGSEWRFSTAGDFFAERLTAKVEAPLKERIKALEADNAGLRAQLGHRGVTPVASGRPAPGGQGAPFGLRPGTPDSEQFVERALRGELAHLDLADR